MRSDFIALTDMINAKMLGMFDLIDKWIPQHNTIKKALLQDIQLIGQEIRLYHTSTTQLSKKKMTKCRNGKNCWYLKQGRCWFYHDCNMKENIKQHDLHHYYQTEKVQAKEQLHKYTAKSP